LITTIFVTIIAAIVVATINLLLSLLLIIVIAHATSIGILITHAASTHFAASKRFIVQV